MCNNIDYSISHVYMCPIDWICVISELERMWQIIVKHSQAIIYWERDRANAHTYEWCIVLTIFNISFTSYVLMWSTVQYWSMYSDHYYHQNVIV